MPSTEEFLAICYECGLTSTDLDLMTYGQCVDFIDAYVEMKDPKKKKNKVKKATQADIDRFFG